MWSVYMGIKYGTRSISSMSLVTVVDSTDWLAVSSVRTAALGFSMWFHRLPNSVVPKFQDETLQER